MGFEKKYERNIILIFLIFFLYAFAMSWNVIQVLYFQDLGLNFSQISFILLIISLTVLVFEIPTGIFTDFYGRKRSILIFAGFLTLVSILITLSVNFYFICFVVFLLGIAFSFASGTISALLFESLKKVGREKKFKKYLAKSQFIFIVVGVLTNYFVPIYFNINIFYPFYFACVSSMLLFGVGLFLFEDKREKSDVLEKLKGGLVENINRQFKVSVRIIKDDYDIVWIILFSAVFGLTIGVFGDLINQPIIKKFYDFSEYGLIFACATVVQSFLLFYINGIIKYFERFNEFLVLVIGWSISLILLVLFIKNIYLVILISGIMWMFGTLRGILVINELNQRISDDSKRATILSSNSMVSSLVLVVCLPIFGFFMDFVSLESVIYFMGGFAFVSGLILILFKI